MQNSLAAPLFDALGALPTGVVPARLVLGYSGGLDSELLACALAEFANHKKHSSFEHTECLLVHVHHGLSQHADEWARHCEARAAHYGLPLVVERVKVKRGARLSLEAEARDARYRALARHLKPDDVLLTAHHEDDQLETVLLALSRGLGPKGLAAMGACQSLSLGDAFQGCAWQLRPFLGFSRETLEREVRSRALIHIEDESNLNTDFDRNFLRHNIIPALKSRFGAIATTASRSARLCAQTQALLDEETRLKLAPLIGRCALSGAALLDLDGLFVHSRPWQAQLLRLFMSNHGFAPPSEVQLHEALSQLGDARVDSCVSLRFGAAVLRRFQRSLYLESADEDSARQARCGAQVPEFIFAQLGDGVVTPLGLLQLGDGAKPCSLTCGPIRSQALSGTLSLRYGLPGSLRLQPAGRVHSRELKKLWQEHAVPSWLRSCVPLLFCDEQPVAALGLWVERSAAADDEHGIYLVLTSG